MEEIENPVASAVVDWHAVKQGGRRSGPPTARVYMATSAFVLGEEDAVQPNWPASADPLLSILLQKTGELDDGRWTCSVGFLAPEMARPYLRPGVELLILEGPHAVAMLRITEVWDF